MEHSNLFIRSPSKTIFLIEVNGILAKKRKFSKHNDALFWVFFCVGNNAPGLQLIKDTNRL